MSVVYRSTVSDGQLSVMYRSTVSDISVNCRSHISRVLIGQLSVAYQSCVNLAVNGSLVSRETVVLRRWESETKIWLYQTS